MDMEKIYRKALALDFLTADEALVLYESGPLDELMSLAWELRQKHVRRQEWIRSASGLESWNVNVWESRNCHRGGL